MYRRAGQAAVGEGRCKRHGWKMFIWPRFSIRVTPYRVLLSTTSYIPLTPRWDSPESHIGIAKKLRDTIPHATILDQYSNPHNPLAHYYGTYPEIRSSLADSTFDNKHVSALFAGAGTGGTITGLARGIRDDEAEAGPSRKRARVVAIDPEGSILGGGDVVGSYEVEGIGYVSGPI